MFVGLYFRCGFVCFFCVMWCASNEATFIALLFARGWSGGAMVLDKLPVPGRPSYFK